MNPNINVTPAYCLAGEATITVSNGLGKHHTFHVYKAKPTDQYPGPAYFIKALTGPDRENDFRYVGKVEPPQGHQ